MLSMKGFGFDGPKCAPSVFAALAVTQSTCSTMFDKTIRVVSTVRLRPSERRLRLSNTARS